MNRGSKPMQKRRDGINNEKGKRFIQRKKIG